MTRFGRSTLTDLILLIERLDASMPIDPILAATMAGVLTEAIKTFGRRLTSAAARKVTHLDANLIETARWFDTYRLSITDDDLRWLPDCADTAKLVAILQSDELQSVIHELMAARITDAPENNVKAIHRGWELSFYRLAADPDTRATATEVFDFLDRKISSMVGQLEGAEPHFLPQLRHEAYSGRIIAILNAIERHTAAISRGVDLDGEQSFLDRYRQHAEDHHGKLEPPDFERRRRIPIKDLYVAPTFAMVRESNRRRGRDRDDEIQLDELFMAIDRTVLLGDPGGGKTTTATVALHHFATKRTQIPFLVTLREFAAQNPERSVVSFIEFKLDTFYQCGKPPPGLVEYLLLTGKALVVFDGLDELIDTSRRVEVTAIVERFCMEYPLTRVLVTSRAVGYDQARLDDSQFQCFRVGRFDEHQVAEYVEKWFAQEYATDGRRSSEAFMSESAEVADLRSNPLMLALMCILYRGEGYIPRNRPEVYRQCATLLFSKWDARRSIHTELQAERLIEPTLRHLAYWMFTREEVQQAVTKRELVREASRFLLGRGFENIDEAEEAAREFVKFCRGRMWVFSDAGTTSSGEPLYTFTHRTFLEFFAASFLAITHDTPEALARTLAPRIARAEWDVVAELAIQSKDLTSDRGAERIIEKLITDRRYSAKESRRNILSFSARCLKSVDPSPRVVRDLTGAVLDQLVPAPAGEGARYLNARPLATLLVSGTNSKDIIREEVEAWVTRMVESKDIATRLAGLSLGAWLPQTIPFSTTERFIEGIYDYWSHVSNECVHKFTAEIRSDVPRDGEMAQIAVRNGLMSLKEAAEAQGSATPFFAWDGSKLFGVNMLPYLPMMLDHIQRSGVADDDLKAFESFGEYLAEHPKPPWTLDRASVTSASAECLSLLTRRRATEAELEEARLTPIQGLGAMVTLAICVEAARLRRHRITRDFIERLAARFSYFHPYAHTRLRGRPHPLPPLPIPADFQQLFQRWAAREVDFVG